MAGIVKNLKNRFLNVSLQCQSEQTTSERQETASLTIYNLLDYGTE